MTTPEDILARCEATALAALPGAPGKRVADLSVYLANVGVGLSMRAIARARGARPSTVLRTIRRVETLRDDPLLDRALTDIECHLNAASSQHAASSLSAKEPPMGDRLTAEKTARSKGAAGKTEAHDGLPGRSDRATLTSLAEPGAFLLIADGAEKAGVFCARNDFRKPVSLTPLEDVTRFAANDWVECVARTDLTSRYVLTAAGRAALRRQRPRVSPRRRRCSAGNINWRENAASPILRPARSRRSA